MKRFEFMTRGAITALAAFGALAIGPAVNAQSVTVRDATGASSFASVCTSIPALSMDPAGTLIITCTPTGTTVTPTIPSCTVANVQVQVGSTALMSASCQGTPPTTYVWTNTVGTAPGFTAANAASVPVIGPFTTAMIGTSYTFSLTASNTVGPAAPVTGTLTVIAPVQAGTCPTVALTGGSSTFSADYGQATLTIPRGGIASIALPPWTAGQASHAYSRFDSAQTTNTQNDVGTQVSISTCAGDFTSNPAPCRAWGVANTGSTTIQGNAGTGARTDTCYMATGTQYYLNVRNVGQDGVTPSCNTSSCGVIVQMHTGYY